MIHFKSSFSVFLCLISFWGYIENSFAQRKNPHAIDLQERKERHQYEALRRFGGTDKKSIERRQRFLRTYPKEDRTDEACLAGAKKYLTKQLNELYEKRKRSLKFISRDFENNFKDKTWQKKLESDWEKNAKNENIWQKNCQILGIKPDKLRSSVLNEEIEQESQAIFQKIIQSQLKGDKFFSQLLVFLIFPHSKETLSKLCSWIKKNKDKETYHLAMVYISQTPLSPQAEGIKPQMLPEINDFAALKDFLGGKPSKKEAQMVIDTLLNSSDKNQWVYQLAFDANFPIALRKDITKGILSSPMNKKVTAKLLLLPVNHDNTVLKTQIFNAFFQPGVAFANFDLPSTLEIISNKDEDIGVRKLALKSLKLKLKSNQENIDDGMADEDDIEKYAVESAKIRKAVENLLKDKNTEESLKKVAQDVLKQENPLDTNKVNFFKKKVIELMASKARADEAQKKNQNAAKGKQNEELLALLKNPHIQGVMEYELGREQMKLFYFELIEKAQSQQGKIPQELTSTNFSLDLYNKPFFFPVKDLNQLSNNLVLAVYPKALENNNHKILLVVSGKGGLNEIQKKDFDKVFSADAATRKKLNLPPIDTKTLLSFY